MYLWEIYTFPPTVFSRLTVGIYKSLTDTRMFKLGDRALSFCFGNNEAAQFHFWEYLNRNQEFILDSHRPFICSAVSSSPKLRNVFTYCTYGQKRMKGSVSRAFRLTVFMNNFFGSPDNSPIFISIFFSRKFAKIFATKGARLVSTTLSL